MEKGKIPRLGGKGWLLALFNYFKVGLVAALVEWGLFALLNTVLHINYLIAVIISFVFSTLTNYILSLKWAFKGGRHSKSTEVIMVYVISLLGLLFNLGLMWLMHGKMGINSIIAKIISTGIVFFWNYYARKLFVF